jgi:cell division protein FtsZ
MENLIKEALASSHAPEKLQKEIGEINIVVIGLGGAGNNSVSRLAQLGIVGARLVCINTDKQHLDRMDKSLEKMLIGETLTNGMGAGGYPNVGERAAEMDRTKLQNLVKGADLVFIVCGLGGGTGTGAAPVIADFAKSEGALVISIATLPF